MKEKTFFSMSPLQTKKLGKRLAKEISKAPLAKGALTLGLIGDLGSGKTTFLKGFAQGLKVKSKILSPTFVIIKRFPLTRLPFANFYHIDCYRIQDPKELLALGLREIMDDPKNMVAVEWAEKIKKLLPPDVSILKFKLSGEQKRKITLKKL